MGVQTVLEDIVAYVTPDLVVFAGRERGTYTHDSTPEALSELSEGRSICIFCFIATQGGWRQVYHHVSLCRSVPRLTIHWKAPGGSDDGMRGAPQGPRAAKID